MEKTIIAKELVVTKAFVIFILGIITLGNWLNAPLSWSAFGSLGAFVFVIFVSLRALPKISFDENFLYVRDGKKTIPIADVIDVTILNYLEISNMPLWKITYWDISAERKSVLLYPANHRALDGLRNMIEGKTTAPNAKTVNF